MQPLLRAILGDEALTRHLGDAEARILIEWLVERAEGLIAASESTAPGHVSSLCRRARAIGLFVGLWCYRRDRGSAGQLASAERFPWPLPPAEIDPCSLMEHILRVEQRSLATSSAA
jgi:hypothetical protein